jgi:hypothetical protein
VNAFAEKSRIVIAHPEYHAPGAGSEARQYSCRELFRNALGSEQLHAIRPTVQTGTPLGNDRLRNEAEKALNCRVGHSRRGNPGRGKGYCRFSVGYGASLFVMFGLNCLKFADVSDSTAQGCCFAVTITR